MRRVLCALALLATCTYVLSTLSFRNVEASRNSAGTMSAANGPYISGTTINSTQVNARFADIESELTNSLDRNGRGGMLAALRGVDGTVAAPALSFTSETGSGLYRIGASDVGFAIAGSKKLELTGSLFTVTPNATFSGTLGVGTAASTLIHALGTTGVPEIRVESTVNTLYPQIGIVNDRGASTAGAFLFLGGSNVTTAADRDVFFVRNSHGDPIVFQTATTERVRISSGGLTIGSAGTAVGALYRGSASWTPGSVAANSCSSTNVTVTGAAVGDECFVGAPGINGAEALSCTISVSNTCVVQVCNVTTGASTFTSGTYRCAAIH